MEEEVPQLTPEEIQDRFNVQLTPGEVPLNFYVRHWMSLAPRASWLLVGLVVAVVLAWLLVFRRNAGLFSLEGIVLSIVFLVLVFMGFYYYTDWRNDALILTDLRLIHVEQVLYFSQQQRDADLDKVQNVNSSVRGLLARLLDYGMLWIETSARGEDITFGPTHRPRAAAQEIQSRIQAIRAEVSAQLMRETLQHRLGLRKDPPQIPALAKPPAADVGKTWLPLPPNPMIEGETIIWHKHYFFLFKRLLGPLLLAVPLAAAAYGLFFFQLALWTWVLWVFFALLVILLLVVQYQLWKGDIYVVTGDTLLDIYRSPWGLFGESRRTTGLGRIQNITSSKPGILALLLNYGNVRIRTAAEEDFSFDLVPRPEEVQREITRKQERFTQRQEQRRREEMADWLAAFRELGPMLREQDARGSSAPEGRGPGEGG